jgi:hypothetical protein
MCLFKLYSNIFFLSFQFKSMLISIPKYLYDSLFLIFAILLFLYIGGIFFSVFLLVYADFVGDMSIPECVQKSLVILNIFYMSSLFFVKSTRSSAKVSIGIVTFPPFISYPFFSFSMYSINGFIYIINNVGDITSPYLTPLSTLKNSVLP